ncbi:PstS family phosphate ABC transporter substrate-binding protein [Gaiella sp.]|uniref:PstS family phosphate ABC transporter substrate-binding protein n=1 Tax=Gaiella sp. TaxID=2663207 RepID=UPI0032637FE0
MSAYAAATKPAVLLGLVVALIAVGCGGGSDGGAISADGSSTVGPYMTAAAEEFQKETPDTRITVGVSGTGGGFERFCRGETDISNASRPIKQEEQAICKENDVEYVEFQIANDALTVVVNQENDWATCLTVPELNAIWKPGSKLGNWDDVRDGFPDVALKLFGPGTDSGTFDYFTDEINGEEGASRTDYAASEDDNVIVQGVSGEKGGLGYLGFSYYEQNEDALNAVGIDGGAGCVAPSVETAQDGTYKPLSRPLYVYVKKTSFAQPAVEDFIGYVLDNETAIAEKVGFVPLNDEQLAQAKDDFTTAVDAATS